MIFKLIEESLMKMVMVLKTMFIRLKLSSIDSERWFSVQRLKICITLEMVNFQDIIELMITQFPVPNFKEITRKNSLQFKKVPT